MPILHLATSQFRDFGEAFTFAYQAWPSVASSSILLPCPGMVSVYSIDECYTTRDEMSLSLTPVDCFPHANQLAYFLTKCVLYSHCHFISRTPSQAFVFHFSRDSRRICALALHRTCILGSSRPLSHYSGAAAAGSRLMRTITAAVLLSLQLLIKPIKFRHKCAADCGFSVGFQWKQSRQIVTKSWFA